MNEVTESISSPAAVEISAPAAKELEPRPPKEATPATPNEEWKKVRKLAVHQLNRFISLEPKVLRGDDPEAIHDMRVASRRLQQVLDLIYPPPTPKGIRKLRGVLRRSRRSLSEVRNCDVLLENVSARLRRKRASRREIWTAVEHYLSQRRSESFKKAQRKISKLNIGAFYLELKDHLAADTAQPGHSNLTSPAAETQPLVPEQFYERTREALARVAQAFENQIAESHRDPRVEVIHAARIATKRLRYLIEVLHEFKVPGGNERLAWLRDLQQHLGHWHDLVVLEELMIAMVARRKFLRDHLKIAMGVHQLIVQSRKNKQGLEEKYLLMTHDSPEVRQMKEWTAHLLSSNSPTFARA